MVRYGVLGLLIERRGYGYELVQRLRARLGGAWQLNPSAVYTALDQLEADGLIEGTARGHGPGEGRPGENGTGRVSRRAARVVYRATDAGVCAFERWMARPSSRVKPMRSELALKVALLSPDSVPALLETIRHEERLILHALGELAPQTPSAPAPGGRWPAAAAALVSAAAVSRLQAELAWLRSVREAVERLLGEVPAPACAPARGAGAGGAAGGRPSVPG